MDQQTLDYYAEHAKQVAPCYEQARGGIANYFGLAFPPGARVLDVGAGTGRDVALLVAEGIDAYGVEPVEAMREASSERHPHLALRFQAGHLPDSLPSCADEGDLFDGVLCSAVLQHLPRNRLFDSVFAIRRLLKPGGRVLLSVPTERDDVGPSGRDAYGRLFNGVRTEELELLFARAGFVSVGRWEEEDELGRPGFRWGVLLMSLQEDMGARPLDRIEGVLSGDRKVATYKLALLRALAEIATTQSRRIRWRPDGRAALPIEAVAERWILYYWPLFEAPAFMPQMSGEWREQTHKLGFTAGLEQLMRAYRHAGRLTAFSLDQRTRGFPPGVDPIYRGVIAKLKRVIQAGPVTYAGGSLASGRLFDYEKGQILIDAALWKELSLTGYWIHDALILRWAEEVSRLSRKEIAPEQVVGLLLRRPEADREVADARRIYESVSDKECVWTGEPLRRSFEIDHVIPFALWRNNDLWNLLPTHPRVNQRKRDKLPARNLLHHRRGVILDYWDLARRECPDRFGCEAEALLGEPKPLLSDLFSALTESVEVTALQRGSARFTG